MKSIIRIPTKEFAFVELHLDEWESPAHLKMLHDEWVRAFSTGEGVDDKTFNSFIEQQLSGKGIENGMIESYEQMNEWQRSVVDVIRRGKARLKTK